MFKGFGKSQAKEAQRRRKFEYDLKTVMGEQVAAARIACIEVGINPRFGQSLIVVATGADLEGWLKSPAFNEMRVSIIKTYATEENLDTLLKLEKTLQEIRKQFAPRINALAKIQALRCYEHLGLGTHHTGTCT